MINSLNIQNMVIFQCDIMLEIMDPFFQWLMLNEYITYKVMLN